MTVIAYRRGCLASDSLVTVGDMRFGTIQKIARSDDGRMCGAAGLAQEIVTFTAWVLSGMDFTQRPTLSDSFGGIVVDPDGTVWSCEDTGDQVVRAEFFAIGSGSEVALGAMWAGASAPRAVEAAISLCTTVGGPIQVLRHRRRK